MLVVILSVMTVIALFMQPIRAEDATVDLWALAAPIWLMGLPVLAIAAAIAVLFESISFLRGGFGNLAYVFLWITALATVLAVGIDEATNLARPFSDLFGYTRQLADIQQQVLTTDPDANVSSGLLTPVRGREVSTFVWDGFDWTVGVVGQRMKWAGLALAIALLSAIPFDRFDPALGRSGSGRAAGREEKSPAFRARTQMAPGWSPTAWGNGLPRRKTTEPGGVLGATAAELTPLTATPSEGQFCGVLGAEFKLMLRGHSPLWYTGAIGLIIACLVSPIDAVQRFLAPAIWLWPILIWSQMGTRECRYHTEQFAFSLPRPVLRQSLAMWLPGVILTVIVGSGAWVRLALIAEVTSLLAWFVGMLFAPSLALALGASVGSSRAFELVYALFWYVGVVNRVAAFDYAGVTAEGLAMGMPVVYLGLSGALVVLSLIGRWRQVRT